MTFIWPPIAVAVVLVLCLACCLVQRRRRRRQRRSDLEDQAACPDCASAVRGRCVCGKHKQSPPPSPRDLENATDAATPGYPTPTDGTAARQREPFEGDLSEEEDTLFDQRTTNPFTISDSIRTPAQPPAPRSDLTTTLSTVTDQVEVHPLHHLDPFAFLPRTTGTASASPGSTPSHYSMARSGMTGSTTPSRGSTPDTPGHSRGTTPDRSSRASTPRLLLNVLNPFAQVAIKEEPDHDQPSVMEEVELANPPTPAIKEEALVEVHQEAEGAQQTPPRQARREPRQEVNHRPMTRLLSAMLGRSGNKGD